MKENFTNLKGIICLLTLIFFSGRSYADIDFKKSAEALVQRVLPGHASDFVVEIIPPHDSKDLFEIESRNNKIILRGNTTVSIASALNWYLKYYAHCQVSWNGSNLNLPIVLPKVGPKVRIETPYNQRVYLNYCTFSYTMAWWDWDRWEKEIDWMALHGINMPLAVTGQEAVWQNTLRKFGMNDTEIRNFLVGPAFFAWQWMTNIESWGGPLPQNLIERNKALGEKILARERSMGMTPILQGFTGYVPIALKQKFPKADITGKPFWLGYFPPGTAQLDPLDPLFAKLGTVFLQEQQKLFGTDHYYGADPFHEGTPPKSYDGYLGEVAKKLYEVTTAVDPKAIIVMQSWSYRPKIADGVPKDRLLVLDLNSSKWKSNNAFNGASWVSGIIHNFGGQVFTGGSLNTVLQQLATANHNSTWGNISGIGMFPEAIEHNPVIYEAASEMAWRKDAPDTEQWLMDYIHARYGIADDHTQKAWKILLHTAYAGKSIEASRESPVCAKPALTVNGVSPNGGLNSERNYKFKDLWAVPEELLQSDGNLRRLSTYQYDLVDVMRQCLADLGIPIQKSITRAYLSGNRDSLKITTHQFLSLIDDMDEVLSTREDFLLGKWIADARNTGDTPAEKDLYEKNARLLVTVWGPYDKNAILFDYSSRQWAGLMKGFYKKRWKRYFEFLSAEIVKDEGKYVETGTINHRFNRPANEANNFYKSLSKWEYQWCDSKEKYNDKPVGDPYTVARKLFDKWQPIILKYYQ